MTKVLTAQAPGNRIWVPRTHANAQWAFNSSRERLKLETFRASWLVRLPCWWVLGERPGSVHNVWETDRIWFQTPVSGLHMHAHEHDFVLEFAHTYMKTCTDMCAPHTQKKNGKKDNKNLSLSGKTVILFIIVIQWTVCYYWFKVSWFCSNSNKNKRIEK